MTTETPALSFGYKRGLPEGGTAAAWGARLIYPNDFLPNRSDTFGSTEDKERLFAMLTERVPQPHDYTPILRAAGLTGSEDREVTIYEDDDIAVKANPQRSFGYLYVVAYLK